VPFVLRKVRRNRWYKDLQEYSWLALGELPADPLGDIATQDCVLSVWLIDDDNTNLEQIIVALAAKSDSLSNFDFALFDLAALTDFELVNIPGETPDASVAHWHRDIVRISATKLVQMMHAVWPTVRTDRRSRNELKKLLIEGVKSNRLDRSKMSEKLLQELKLSGEG
jgi:hypothetical protein